MDKLYNTYCKLEREKAIIRESIDALLNRISVTDDANERDKAYFKR